jgi:hypothetical protein
MQHHPSSSTAPRGRLLRLLLQKRERGKDGRRSVAQVGARPSCGSLHLQLLRLGCASARLRLAEAAWLCLAPSQLVLELRASLRCRLPVGFCEALH